MLLRICLIVAVVTTLGALGVSFKVSQKINDITLERDQFADERTDAQDAERKAKKEASEARTELEDANSKLAETETRLELAEAESAEQRVRADDLNRKLINTTAQRNDAQAELAKWEATGLSVPQVLGMKAELAEVRTVNGVLTSENGLLSRKLATVESRLNNLTIKDYEVKLPAGVHGTVTAVDPKFKFVVLDIGKNQNLLEFAKLAVARNGKLVGKVRIASLEDRQSIANILPGWDLAEIREGDQVLTSYEALPRE